MKKLLFILMFLSTLGYSQSLPFWFSDDNGNGKTTFSAVDLDGSTEYMYRNYAQADSFLNMNGYERTVLPQSTMKINNSLKDSIRTFTTANDTNKWNSYNLTTALSIVGGKLRFTLNSSGTSGIRLFTTDLSGARIYVKFKIRFISGTPVAFYAGLNNSSNLGIVFTPTTEERTIEGTYLNIGSYPVEIASLVSNSSVYEIDDIEVREITNLVSNGTFASDVSWTKGTGVAISGGTAHFDGVTASDPLYQNVGLASGKRYIITYQISSYTSGSIGYRIGGTLFASTNKSATGVYSDTVLAWANANGNLVFSTNADTAFTGELDNVHCYEIPSYWSSSTSNHKMGWSKIDALTGAGDTTSIKMISTGAGDSVYNNIKILSGVNTFHGFTNGNKYTIEAWVRGTGVRGSDLISGWDFTSGWGTSSATVTNATTFSTSSAGGILKTGLLLTSGKTYRIVSRGTISAGTLNIFSGSGGSMLTSSTGTFSQTDYVTIGTVGVTGFYLRATEAATITITKLEVEEITLPTLTLSVQGQLKSTASISCIPSTFTKVVWNFQANASWSVDTLKFWCNQADTLFLDSVQIKQAFDFTVSSWVYSTGTSGDKPVLWNKYVSNNAARGYGFYINNTTLNGNISDSVNTSSGLTATIQTNQWNLVTLSYNRTAYCSLYVNGVYQARADISGIGIFNNRPLNLGWDNASGRFQGQLGELRITKFSDLASSTWTTSTPLTMYNAYTNGTGFSDNITGGGKKIVVWYDWTTYDTDANFLMDLSGNQYNLTGSSVTTADHTFWKK